MAKNDVVIIKQALLSVTDKSGLNEFAHFLHQSGTTLLASGGTAALLKQHHTPVTEIADYTGFAEILDGRVKTLHPKIHAGILARRGIDAAQLTELAIPLIDLVVVNLYAFKQTVAKTTDEDIIIENIDIGGPTLIRAAAKNFHDVVIIVDPNDYARIQQEMTEKKGISFTTRQQLAAKAFAYIADYDAAIANYFAKKNSAHTLPDQQFISLYKHTDLRYGENPQQVAALYQQDNATNNWQQLQGKTLSFNNLMDADTAYRGVQLFSQAACVIVKHANPCGAAIAKDLLSAYQRAYQTDPQAAFGGIVAFNKLIDAKTAQTIADQQFVEVIIAPEFSSDALSIFAKKPNLRLLQMPLQTLPTVDIDYKNLVFGLLIQSADHYIDTTNNTIISARQPTETELTDLHFAWQVVKLVKSNAIVIAKQGQTLGIGAGQCSRVHSTQIAIEYARQQGFDLQGAVLASDAFFPFADNITLAAEAGITAIIQPGGSVRDNEVIAAVNQARISMIFTGQRHFRH